MAKYDQTKLNRLPKKPLPEEGARYLQMIETDTEYQFIIREPKGYIKFFTINYGDSHSNDMEPGMYKTIGITRDGRRATQAFHFKKDFFTENDSKDWMKNRPIR